jgi:hypothetical protein
MTRKMKLVLLAPLAIVGFAVFIAIGGSVVMLLWNWLVPPIFGWPAITFWQAVGLLALCRILFGGIGMRGGRPRRRMADSCQPMTPEERERFRERLRDRWGFGASTTGTGGQ